MRLPTAQHDLSVTYLVDTNVALHLRDGDARLETLLSAIPVLAFDGAAANAHAAIVARVGDSRRKQPDRMIAPHALAHRTTLVTRNADDFRDIAGLDMQIW